MTIQQLKDYINLYIYQNTIKAITGTVLNDVLKVIVDFFASFTASTDIPLWNVSTEYKYNDIVRYNDNLYVYIYLTPSTGISPDNAVYWNITSVGALSHSHGNKSILDVVSGTNTGDETTSTILNKIGNGSVISSNYLPSYVDDVLEYANFAAFPVTGEAGKIYIALDTNIQYRWGGTVYIELSKIIPEISESEVVNSSTTSTDYVSGRRIFTFWNYFKRFKQNSNVGICAMLPILPTDIIINYTNRTLTIATVNNSAISESNPIRFFTNGNGLINIHEKYTPVEFTWTNTSGIWYFYFDSTGTPISSLSAWTQFDTIATVYRMNWNSTKVLDADKSITEWYEAHVNDISASDHSWKHSFGAIWKRGFDIVSNFLTSGAPNSDGRNTCISLSTGVAEDDNLQYTITNSQTIASFNQDSGNINAAELTNLNAGLFKIRYKGVAGISELVPATRFPFLWNPANNYPQYVDVNGNRVDISNNYFFVCFVYVLQDPRYGNAVRITPYYGQFATINEAKAVTWSNVQAQDIGANDNEIRPLHRLIFEFKTSYSDLCKYSALRDVTDIRKGIVVQQTSSGGSVQASSISLVTSGFAWLLDSSISTVQILADKVDSFLNSTFNILKSDRILYYYAASKTIDTSDDIRFRTLGTNMYIERCTATGAKGSGTWIESMFLDRRNGSIYTKDSDNNYHLYSDNSTGNLFVYKKGQSEPALLSASVISNIPTDINHKKGKYFYMAADRSVDTTADIRWYVSGQSIIYEVCESGGLPKNQGTWVKCATISIYGDGYYAFSPVDVTDFSSFGFGNIGLYTNNVKTDAISNSTYSYLSKLLSLIKTNGIYFANSNTADTIGDKRIIMSGNDLLIQHCTAANAAKSSGTWATKVTIKESGNIEINDYTKLGSTAPALKIVELTGTTSNTEGGLTEVVHGSTSAKINIISAKIQINPSPETWIDCHDFQADAGLQSSVYFDNNNVYIKNHPTNSETILNKPFVILIAIKE